MLMSELSKHFIVPGTLFVSKRPIYLWTILGSCVSVCLWDDYLKIGGINHFILPYWNGDGLASPKYGNIAIAKLIHKMYALGSNRQNLVAKVFGGGEVIEFNNHHFNVGSRNIASASKTLQEYDIPIIARKTGGKKGQKIIFNTQTNEVRLTFINQLRKS